MDSIHSPNSPSFSPNFSSVLNVSSNFDLYQTSPHCPEAVGIASASSEDANVTIGGYVESFASALVAIGVTFVKTVVNIANAVERAYEFTAEKLYLAGEYSAHGIHQTAHTLTNSTESWWDDDAWEDKLDIDNVKTLLSLSDETDLTKLNKGEEDKAVETLMAKLPRNANGDTQRFDGVGLSRKDLKALLNELNQELPLVRIVKKFLEKTAAKDPDCALNYYEWAMVSVLMKAIIVQHKDACKQAHKDVEREYQKYAALHKPKFDELYPEIKRKHRNSQIKNKEQYLKELTKKEADKDSEVQKALAEFDKVQRASLTLQWKLNTAKKIPSFFVWLKHAYTFFLDRVDEKYQPEYDPGFSKVNTESLTIGVDFGIKNVFKELSLDPDFYAGVMLKLMHTQNVFADDEFYRGWVAGQWDPSINVRFKAGWEHGDCLTGFLGTLGITHSVFARYSETGKARKFAAHQFNDHTGENTIEYAGHHYDSLADKHHKDPDCAPFSSRLGIRTDSYLGIPFRNEVKKVYDTKKQLDAMKNAMQVQLSLAVSSISQDALYAIPESERQAALDTNPQFYDLKREQEKGRIRERARSEINALEEQLKALEPEQRLANQAQIHAEIKKIESQLWASELKIDLYFKLLKLNGKDAAQLREKISAELGQEWRQCSELVQTEISSQLEEEWNKKRGLGRVILPVKLALVDSAEDDNRTKEILAEYQFKLKYVECELEKALLKQQLAIRVAEAKSTCKDSIQRLEDDYADSPKQERKQSEKEELARQRDFLIRSLEKDYQLQELKIDRELHLFGVEMQSPEDNEKINKVNKEYKIKKAQIKTHIALLNLQHKQFLELNKKEREWETAYSELKTKEREFQANPKKEKFSNLQQAQQRKEKLDRELAKLDFEHAKQIRARETALKLKELDIELAYEKDPEVIGELTLKKARIEKKSQINELELQRDFDIDELTDPNNRGQGELALMQKCDFQVREIKDELKAQKAALDPWRTLKDQIRTISKKDTHKKRKQLETLTAQKKEESKLNQLKLDLEINQLEAEIRIHDLQVEQLIALIPLQSATARECIKNLSIALGLTHLLKNVQLPNEKDSVKDEQKAQKKRIINDFKIATEYKLGQLKKIELQYAYDVENNKKELALKMKESEEIKESGDLYASLLAIFNAELKFHLRSSQLRTDFHLRLDQLNKEIKELPQLLTKPADEQRIKDAKKTEDERKAIEAAKANAYLRWIPVRNHAPISIGNTDIEHSGAYLADYWTYYGNGSANGSGGGVLTGALEGAGVAKNTGLTREKYSNLCVGILNTNKSPAEKEGVMKLINKHLYNPPHRSMMDKLSAIFSPPKRDPRSTLQIIIDHWKTRARGAHELGPKLGDEHFTIENFLNYIRQDVAVYIDAQHKLLVNEDSTKQGAGETLVLLQQYYAANSTHEMIENMNRLLGLLACLSADGPQQLVPSSVAPDTASAIRHLVNRRPSEEVIALQNQIKEVEAVLTEQITVDKWQYWRNCGLEEHQEVSVTSRRASFAAKAKIGVGPFSEEFSLKLLVDYLNRYHVVHSRHADFRDIYIGGEYKAGLSINGIPDLDQSMVDGLNNAISGLDSFLVKNPFMLSNSSSLELTRVFRTCELRYFKELYAKHNRPYRENIPVYARVFETRQDQVNGEISVPLDKIVGVPVHPVIGGNRTKTTTKYRTEIWRGCTFNHPLMHYTHARDIGDLDRNTGVFLNKENAFLLSRVTQRYGYTELFNGSGQEQWTKDPNERGLLDELFIRTVHFEENRALPHSTFRKFMAAQKRYLSTARYFHALGNMQEEIAALEQDKSNEEVNAKLKELKATHQAAMLFFQGKKGVDPYDHCFDRLKDMFHAYSPHDYFMLVNSNQLGASSMVVHGERRPTYEKPKELWGYSNGGQNKAGGMEADVSGVFNPDTPSFFDDLKNAFLDGQGGHH